MFSEQVWTTTRYRSIFDGAKIMSEQSGKPHRDVADYISTVTAQLAQMAASEHYTTLAHVLEMAWLESEQLCGRDSVTPRRHSLSGHHFSGG
jgi:hypothetical protein